MQVASLFELRCHSYTLKSVCSRSNLITNHLGIKMFWYQFWYNFLNFISPASASLHTSLTFQRQVRCRTLCSERTMSSPCHRRRHYHPRYNNVWGSSPRMHIIILPFIYYLYMTLFIEISRKNRAKYTTWNRRTKERWKGVSVNWQLDPVCRTCVLNGLGGKKVRFNNWM